MADIKKIIRGLKCCLMADCTMNCPYATIPVCSEKLMTDALALLKEQEKEMERFINWLGRFCAHVDQQFQPLPDEQNIKFFREKIKQQFGWEVSGDG